MAIATFAGGCFWCLQPTFDKTPGVSITKVGYLGGKQPNPTYQQVCSGNSGHVEAIQVTYDPNVVDYQTLLDIFWKLIDPTQADGQFCDIGSQYETAIFYHDTEQHKLALASKKWLEQSGRIDAVETKILPATTFYPAEDYHQGYYKKNAAGYMRYKIGSGREQRLNELWGD
jgi:methionine-S-sulfoxide reductase